MPIETTKWEVQDFLTSSDARAIYLEAAFEDGDPKLITAALGDVAKAMGMSTVAKEAGITREALYRALKDTGDPKLSTIIGVVRALGLQLSVAVAHE